MSTVQPPPPNPSLATQAGATATQAVAVKIPAQLLQSLIPGQPVLATVLAMGAGGQAQVKTALGEMIMSTSMLWPKGAALTLVPTALTPQPAFVVSHINGKPLPGAALVLQAKGLFAEGVSARPTADTTSLPTASPLSALQIGAKVDVVLLRPTVGVPGAALSPQSAQGAPSPAHSGSAPGQGSVTSFTQPQASGGGLTPMTASPATGAGQQGAQLSAAPNVAQGGGDSQPTFPTMLPAGTRFPVHIEHIEHASAAVSTPSTAAAKGVAQGAVLTGVVAGRTTDGQPIVQTPAGPFALEARSGLGEGAKVTFRLAGGPLVPATALTQAGGASGAEDMVRAKAWSDLWDAMRALAQADPQRLAQVAHNALPQPGPRLGSQMLFFLSALRGGDLESLFGDTASRLIEKERPGLLARMTGDFQVMAKLAEEPQAGDWRLALIPVWTGEELEQARLYWRHGGGSQEGGEGDPGEETRFVLDVDMSRLGHVQIDGLVKAKRQHMDLIMRTDRPLPDGMRADIAGIVMEAKETVGLGGTVAFQSQPANFVAFAPLRAKDAREPGFIA